MEVRAISRGVHVSPRKVRLILKRLPGLTVDEALALLRYVPPPHARTVAKTVLSAASNAENNFSLDIDSLYIKQAYAGDGVTMKRYKARSRGRAAPRLRRHSHITIIVDQREVQ